MPNSFILGSQFTRGCVSYFVFVFVDIISEIHDGKLH